MNGYHVSDSTGWGVAVVLKDTNDEANARLIAAAPAMLQAMEAALLDLECCYDINGDSMGDSDAAVKLRAAIAAAKGE